MGIQKLEYLISKKSLEIERNRKHFLYLFKGYHLVKKQNILDASLKFHICSAVQIYISAQLFQWEMACFGSKISQKTENHS